MKYSPAILLLLSAVFLMIMSVRSCRDWEKENIRTSVTVIGKDQEGFPRKHGIRIESHLFAKMDDGTILTINPTAYTYFHANTGDKLHFVFSKEELHRYSQGVLYPENSSGEGYLIGSLVCLIFGGAALAAAKEYR